MYLIPRLGFYLKEIFSGSYPTFFPVHAFSALLLFSSDNYTPWLPSSAFRVVIFLGPIQKRDFFCSADREHRLPSACSPSLCYDSSLVSQITPRV